MHIAARLTAATATALIRTHVLAELGTQQTGLTLSVQAEKPKADDVQAAKAKQVPAASSASTSTAAPISNGLNKSAAEPPASSSSGAQTLPPVEPSAAVADGSKPKDAAKKVSASPEQCMVDVCWTDMQQPGGQIGQCFLCRCASHASALST